MPGSGDRVPAKLRLGLASYVGVACGLFAAALAGAAYVVVFLFFFVPDIDQSGLLFSLAVGALTIVSWASPFLILGLWRAFKR